MTTIKDIARETGYSVSTVSAVLRGHGEKLGIKPSTRGKVEACASRLGYLRNEIARNMVRGRSNVIAYVDRSLDLSEYVGRILSSIMRTAGGRGCYVKLFAFDRRDPDRSLNAVLGQRPAGIICRALSGEDYERYLNSCETLGIPVCSLASPGQNERGWFVRSLDSEGIHKIARHLHDLGHRRIASLARESSNGNPSSRQLSFARAASELGLDIPEHLVRSVPASKLENAAEELLDFNLDERPTAICCGSDYAAMDVIRVANRRGLRLPADLSITGFADLSLAQYACPRLTTARQRFEEIGERAANMVLNAVEEDTPTGFTRLINEDAPVDLTIRESTQAFPPR